MLRFLVRELLPPPLPPSGPAPADPVDVVAERIRHVPGVSVVWWYGQGPYFACARHCGEGHAVSARTLVDALLQLEEDVRATNRETVREAFRLL